VSIAMIFPGQGSQSQGMQADLADEFPFVRETYDAASEILGYDLWELVQAGPAEKLAETVITQPAMLTAGYVAWLAWKEMGGTLPACMAGHSLGEYTALVCAGALSFSDGLNVVKRRSELMQAAVPVGTGAMAAIIGLEDTDVMGICDAVDDGVVQAVNFNAPGQVVIAGHLGAVEKAVKRAEEEGARRAIKLPVSVPSHSSLMVDAGRELAKALDDAEFAVPEIPVFNATDATPYTDPTDIRNRLATQVHRPVQWVRTVNAMLDAGVTSFVECGPGKVLAGLVRRIDRKTPVGTIDSKSGLDKALELQDA
jgi:[acyl-carrier-protein] S-malonyltransferase